MYRLTTLFIFFLFAIQANAIPSNSREIAIQAIDEIFIQRNPDAVEKWVVENYRQHQPGIPNGRKPFKEYLKKLFIAFPDYTGEIENIVVQDDLVSFHFKWWGTHEGTFLGVKPTGKKITRRTADVLRIKNGKIVEHWGIVDQVNMLKDLGLLKTVR